MKCLQWFRNPNLKLQYTVFMRNSNTCSCCDSHVPEAATVSAGSSHVAPEGQYGGVSPLHFPTHVSRSGRALLDSPVYIHDQFDTEKKGLFISTVTVGNATAAHTGKYICYYDSNNNTEETSIYIYVPGTDLFFYTSQNDKVTLFKK